MIRLISWYMAEEKTTEYNEFIIFYYYGWDRGGS